MKIIVTKDYDELSSVTANIVVKLIKEKPDLVFCLPAGSSPMGMYERLVTMYQNNQVDFSQMITFNMDEYVGLTADDKNCYAYFMQKHFLQYVNVNPDNVHHPDAMSDDLDKECARYSNSISEKGGLDLAITGIGDNGHIAFNEPNDFLLPQTHYIELDQETILANSRFFAGDITKVPKQAISIGMAEIMKCRNFLLVASGLHKAPLLKRLFENDHIDTWYPASFLYLHPNVTLILDQDATSQITKEILEKYE